MNFYQEEVKKALIILSHHDPLYQIYVKEEENLKNELIEFNRLKENEKNLQNEIKKINEKLAKKDKQLKEKDIQIKKLKNKINILKNNNK